MFSDKLIIDLRSQMKWASKMRQYANVYIDSSSIFVFYEILCSSNFFCRTSTRYCSRGSPGGWIKIFMKLVDIYHMKIH